MGLSLVTRPLVFCLATALALTGSLAHAADAGPQPSHYLPPGVAAPPAGPPAGTPPTLKGSTKDLAKGPTRGGTKASAESAQKSQKKGPKKPPPTTGLLFHLHHHGSFP